MLAKDHTAATRSMEHATIRLARFCRRLQASSTALCSCLPSPSTGRFVEGYRATSSSALPDRLALTSSSEYLLKWVPHASDCECRSKMVDSRHPRTPSLAVQGSIGRQHRHTITSSRMARPNLSPQSRRILLQPHSPELGPLVPQILNNFPILRELHLYTCVVTTASRTFVEA